MKFKAFSIVAPFGNKIAEGLKRIEVRHWTPPEVPLKNIVIVENSIRLSRNHQEDFEGKAIAMVDIVQVSPWTKDQLAAACCSEFTEGYYAWHLENIRRITPPQKSPAKRKFYEIELTGISLDGQARRHVCS